MAAGVICHKISLLVNGVCNVKRPCGMTEQAGALLVTWPKHGGGL